MLKCDFHTQQIVPVLDYSAMGGGGFLLLSELNLFLCTVLLEHIIYATNCCGMKPFFCANVCAYKYIRMWAHPVVMEAGSNYSVCC